MFNHTDLKKPLETFFSYSEAVELCLSVCPSVCVRYAVLDCKAKQVEEKETRLTDQKKMKNKKQENRLIDIL